MLYLHAGLHKTGTTSFQAACLENRARLREAGIDYPNAPSLLLGSVPHLGVVTHFLELPELLATTLDTSCHDVLLSSEELVNRLGATPDEQVERVFRRLARDFDGLTIVVTVRSDRALANSILREHASGSGFYGLRDVLPSYRKNIENLVRVAKLCDAPLVAVDMDAKPAGVSLPTYYLAEMTGASVDLGDTRLNVTNRDDVARYFLLAFRGFYAELDDAHPFATSVQDKINRAQEAITIDPAFAKSFASDADRLYDRVVEAYFATWGSLVPPSLRDASHASAKRVEAGSQGAPSSPHDSRQPVVPSRQVRYACGHDDFDEFLRTGAEITTQLRLALKKHANRQLSDFPRVLDFGCGAGRIARFTVKDTSVFGCDINAAGVEFCNRRLEAGEFYRNDHLPPLRYASGTFDLVYSISVFSHLRRDVEEAWLQELARVGAPGCVYLLTIQGEWMIDQTLGPDADDARSAGFLYLPTHERHGDANDFPDYYESSYHTSAYVRQQWSKHFEIIDIIQGDNPRRYLTDGDAFAPDGAVPRFRPMGEDLVVARKRVARPSHP